jgi:hypothetical protein
MSSIIGHLFQTEAAGRVWHFDEGPATSPLEPVLRNMDAGEASFRGLSRKGAWQTMQSLAKL